MSYSLCICVVYVSAVLVSYLPIYTLSYVCSVLCTCYISFSFLSLPLTSRVLSFTEHRCELGDLAGRFGTITDIDMPLYDMDTTGQLLLEDIIGLAVVIHEEGSTDIIACGTIIEEPREFHYRACEIIVSNALGYLLCCYYMQNSSSIYVGRMVPMLCRLI